MEELKTMDDYVQEYTKICNLELQQKKYMEDLIIECKNVTFNINKVKILLKLIDNINFGELATPLHIACANNNFEMIKLLVEHGANVNAVDDKNRTPLYFTLLHQTYDINIVKYLVENGADVNIQSNIMVDSKACKYQTILFLAIGQSLECVKYLVEHGANVNAVTYSNANLLMNCILFQYDINIIKYLIENDININEADDSFGLPIYAALYRKNLEIIKLLVDNGANVLQCCKNTMCTGMSALYVACIYNYTDAFLYMVKYGNDITSHSIMEQINVLFKNEWMLQESTMLIAACKNNNFKIVEWLVEHNADINLKNNLQCNALYYAVYTRNLELVKYLVENGADVNTRTTKYYLDDKVVRSNTYSLLECILNTQYSSGYNNELDKIRLYLRENGALYSFYCFKY